MLISFADEIPQHVFEQVSVGQRLAPIQIWFFIEPEPECTVPVRVRSTLGDFGKLYAGEAATPLDPTRAVLAYSPGGNNFLRIELRTGLEDLPSEGPYQAELTFVPEGGTSASYWIRVERILREPEPFRGVFAVDLGTTNTSCAYWELNRQFKVESPPLFGDASFASSAIRVTDAAAFESLQPESYLVGRRALPYQRRTTFVTSYKRGVGSQVKQRVWSGKDIHECSPEHFMQCLAKKVIEDVESRLGRRLVSVLVTSPPGWSTTQVEKLRTVFRNLGFATEAIDTETDEATAAGLFYILDPLLSSFGSDRVHLYLREAYGCDSAGAEHGANVLTLDFGGGTTDLALMRVDVRVAQQRIHLRLEIVDRGSFEFFGGDNLTLHLFRYLKRRLALALCNPIRLAGDACAPPAKDSPWLRLNRAPGQAAFSKRLNERWGDVLEAGFGKLSPELDELVNQLFPTAWNWQERGWPDALKDCAPKTPVRRPRQIVQRNLDYLWSEAQRIKEELCEVVSGAFEGHPTSEDLTSHESPLCSPDLTRGPSELLESLTATDPSVLEEHCGIRYDAIDAFYVERLTEVVASAKSMARRSLWRGSKEIDRVVLAGNGARVPRIWATATASVEAGGLGMSPEQVEYRPNVAKQAVPRGAVLRRVARRVEGFELDLGVRRKRLESAVCRTLPMDHVTCFDAGDLDEFSFFQTSGEKPEADLLPFSQLHPDGSYRDWLMFSLSLKEQRSEVPHLEAPPEEVKAVFPGLENFPPLRPLVSDSFGQSCFDFGERNSPGVGKNRIEFADPEAPFAPNYPQTNATALAQLHTRMSIRDKIAWIEAFFDHPPKSLTRRYYLGGEHMRLLLVQHEPGGEKFLFESMPHKNAWSALTPAKNPFSGIH